VVKISEPSQLGIREPRCIYTIPITKLQNKSSQVLH